MIDSDGLPISFISPAEFARITSMEYGWVTDRCRRGLLPAEKNGKYWTIERRAGLKLFRSGKL